MLQGGIERDVLSSTEALVPYVGAWRPRWSQEDFNRLKEVRGVRGKGGRWCRAEGIASKVGNRSLACTKDRKLEKEEGAVDEWNKKRWHRN